jgi:hypothetical protein
MAFVYVLAVQLGRGHVVRNDLVLVGSLPRLSGRTSAPRRASSDAQGALLCSPLPGRWFQPSCCQVQPPLMSKALAPARLTVSGQVKLLLSMMFLVSVLASLAS